ncbi:MAG: tail fiber domain-containing protein [bacterium]|nr:tail fiber domain-containing protein [bacterium]
MRRTLVWSLTFIVAALAFVGAATGAPSTVSYQGRLTSSSGTPVADGSYSITFSIWTDSVAGSMIWSESQTVQVTGGGGLFSTQLGGLQPLGGELIIHADDELFLQTAVSGTPLLPRLALGSVPHAFVSSSVSQTVPGKGSVHMGVGEDTTKIITTHESFSNLLDSYVHLTDDRALMGLKSYNPSQSYRGSSNSEISGSVIRNFLDLDDDADGVPDVVEDMSVQPGTATLSVSSSKRRFNLMDAFPQRFVVSAHDSDTASSVSSALESDADADGIANGSVWAKVDNTDVISVAGVDVDEDGDTDVGNSSSAKISRSILKTFFERGDKPTQSQIVDSVDENGAYHGTTRYTGSDFERFHVSLMPDSAVVSTEASNPDGSSSSRMRVRVNELEARLQSIGILARSSSTSSLTPDSASETIEVHGAGAQIGRVVSVSSSTDIDSAVTEILGQDATSAGSIRLTAQPAGPTVVNLSSMDASSGTPIIKGSALMTSSPSSVAHSLEWDEDGDGVFDRRVTEDCDDDDAGISIQAGVAIPKFINVTAQAQAAAQKADIGMLMGVGSDTTIKIGADDDEAGVTIQSGVAIPRFIEMNAKSQSSAHQASVGLVMGAGPDTAVAVYSDESETKLRFKAPQSGHYTFDFAFTPASGSVSMTDSLGAISMQMDGDGRLGVGGPAHANNPIDHPSSGAHLTSGGVWTNASDENLKENFRMVNGEELLEKLEELPISQWNYKSESDNVTHIGPTAQDFQKVFGVGENDKTISTIDPSGIALAAIKELNKQNLQLHEESKKIRKENERLQKELNELRARVDKLISGK